MLPTVRRISGRSTSSSTRRSSSSIATRVSRGLPAINISRFNWVHLGPRHRVRQRVIPERIGGRKLVNLNERHLGFGKTQCRAKNLRRLDGAIVRGREQQLDLVVAQDRQFVDQ